MKHVETAPAPSAPESGPAERTSPWWRVMCLTGVDYFSSLGYQPGIAAIAAGLLSPLATIVLVALTLLGALPVYRRVAEASPHGQGSIAMLEHLLGRWGGKVFVLVLLGFAVTDFVITMTLSAADGATHLVQNPHVPSVLAGHQAWATYALLALLGAVFLRGFTEAIGIAVTLVSVYLTLNAVVIVVCLAKVASHTAVIGDWRHGLTTSHGSVLAMVGVSLIVFPKLALGMSGFETGVAVMPQVRGDAEDTEAHPVGRIRNTRRLLTTAALIMSLYLVTSSIVCTLLIPQSAFEPGGAADGRALAYLAHLYLGSGFGTVYDVSTLLILWFAGASAMAGLLNLIPRYLPRYGMSPQWAGATRPLVVIITAIAFLITAIFHASVSAQGGAYATGVLVLMTSAAVAVTLEARRRRQRVGTVVFGLIALVFVYTLVNNCIERPDGLKIAACFIAAILIVSAISRTYRAFELRITDVELDDAALHLLRHHPSNTIRLVANEHGDLNEAEYRAKVVEACADNHLQREDWLFVEVTVTDPSEFSARLEVHGVTAYGKHRVLRMRAPSVPNALAALLLHIRDVTGLRPHIYFAWTEGNPLRNALRFLFLGEGEIAPITREILRRAEPDRDRRPHVHVS
ncbi:amino acid transporter [Nocardioides sp.]|uniref:amino acid transporter n=1 Tax=Nocardioides sp. TaxID=35761 RepID=UPI0034545C2F